MSFLLGLHVFITLCLIGVILIQKSEGGGLGMGSSASSAGMFSARGAANLLTRITAVLAIVFMGNCVLMTVVAKSELKASAAFLKKADKK